MRLSAIVALLAPAVATADPAGLEYFESKVRPVLVDHCVKCHGDKKQMGGLRLDTAAGVTQGGDAGPVVGGDPMASKLVTAVRRTGEYPMPPAGPLPPDAVAALTEWVKRGAPYPKDTPQQKSTPAAGDHWAFKPVADPPVPATAPNAIDAFVRAKLPAGVAPAPPADRRTLIRRAYFDLLGLPPTADEVEAFASDESPDAWAKLIDKLLASPHYGERWGRHWLDVARYADSKGYVFTEERGYPYAYTYRDYVIRAFNDDVPFDRFLIEQIAADKVPNADPKSLAALGFLTVGRRFINNTHDIIDDRIDVVSRGLMGLTVACARCHDHKFDPIPTADYYALYGVFASTAEPKPGPLLEPARDTAAAKAFEAELARMKKAAADFADKMYAEHLAKFRTPEAVAAYLVAAFDARGKSPDQADPLAVKRKLEPRVLARWREVLEDGKVFPAVFGPWRAVNTPAFAESLKKAYPPLAAALTAAKATTPAEVAKVYAAQLTAATDGRLLAAFTGPDGAATLAVPDADKFVPIVVKREFRKLRNAADKFAIDSPNAPPRAMAVEDLRRPVNQVVFVRGNPANRGPAVERRFLTALSAGTPKPFADGSGRLELAKAIASPTNPLTARVFVNRVWLHHFGQGLVRSPSDFGVRTEPPTHPELLDWLATRFVKDGWSVKALHRRILLSATYQQSATADAKLIERDPDNRLLARQTRKRLEFEPLRDSMLAAAGRLDPKVYGKSVDLFAAPFTTRRAVYGLIDRQNLDPTLRAFDLASPDQHTPQRFQTTVPQQALFLMNSPFVAEQAKAVVARPDVTAATEPGEKARMIFRAVLGRDAAPDETRLAVEYVAAAKAVEGKLTGWESLAQALLASNEFAFVD